VAIAGASSAGGLVVLDVDCVSPPPTDSFDDGYLPAMTLAKLSNTENSFTLNFNQKCYCHIENGTVVSPFLPTLCGHDYQTQEFDGG